MNPDTYNLSIYQNATYAMTFIWYAGGCGCGTVGATLGQAMVCGKLQSKKKSGRWVESPANPLLNSWLRMPAPICAPMEQGHLQ